MIRRIIGSALILSGILGLFFLLLGLHDMDNGHNLQRLEGFGYEVVETSLKGDILDADTAYQQGFRHALIGAFLLTLPMVSIPMRGG